MILIEFVRTELELRMKIDNLEVHWTIDSVVFDGLTCTEVGESGRIFDLDNGEIDRCKFAVKGEVLDCFYREESWK